jgi:hypothetical protein
VIKGRNIKVFPSPAAMLPTGTIMVKITTSVTIEDSKVFIIPLLDSIKNDAVKVWVSPRLSYSESISM